ncbi:MAG: 3-deoxy-D-manno-octulosonate cytidylyltransferase [Alphaproteobacteria bacterium 32-64-14]|nr:MAG: 3-deoxy-D-manno-octulosonate cytidylyltransferase [Alphaproteobacteria bacterium 32-64-14]
MKSVIVIPARYASTRLPGKPLQLINGVSMLARTVDAARKAGKATGASVLVATDDDRIAAHCREIGVASVMTDPDLPSGTDRCRAAAAIAAPDADFIVNLQGDAPFTPPEHVAALIANAAHADVVTPVIPLTWDALDRLRENKKVTPFSGTTCIRGPDGRALWFSKLIIPAMRKEEKLRVAGPLSPVLQHVGLYGYTREALARIAALQTSRYEELEGLEQLRFIENGLSVHAVEVAASALPSAGIDSPEDVVKAEAALQRLGDPYGK